MEEVQMKESSTTHVGHSRKVSRLSPEVRGTQVSYECSCLLFRLTVFRHLVNVEAAFSAEQKKMDRKNLTPKRQDQAESLQRPTKAWTS